MFRWISGPSDVHWTLSKEVKFHMYLDMPTCSTEHVYSFILHRVFFPRQSDWLVEFGLSWSRAMVKVGFLSAKSLPAAPHVLIMRHGWVFASLFVSG